MGLEWDTGSPRVSHSGGTSLSNLDPLWVCMWCYPDSVLGTHHLFTWQQREPRFWLDGSKLHFHWSRDGVGDLDYKGTSTVKIEWKFFSVWVDTSQSGNQCAIHSGDATHAPTENQYSISQNGHGALSSNLTRPILFGIRKTLGYTQPFDGVISQVIVLNMKPTDGQIRQMWSRMARRPNVKVFAEYGNPAITQRDRSGNAYNGAVVDCVSPTTRRHTGFPPMWAA